MIATLELKTENNSATIEVDDKDGLLLFYFREGENVPNSLLIGQATAEGFVDAAILCLKTVSQAAHEELNNGTQDEDSGED